MSLRSFLPALPGLSALILTLLTLAVVDAALWPGPAGRGVAACALLLYLLLEAPRLSAHAWKILAMAGAGAAAAALFHPHPLPLLRRALEDGALLIGLFSALNLLRDAAASSSLLQRCGSLLVRQPPGRRFLALALGAHLVGLVLNFGVLSLFGTMVVQGNTLEAAGGDKKIAEIRTRRMMSALLRGFGLMTVWSPLSVSFAVVQSVVPGVDWATLLPLQGILTVLLLGLGWLMDKMMFPPRQLPPVAASDSPPSRAELRPLLSLTALVLSIVVASVGLGIGLHIRLIEGAMLAVPLAAFLWLTGQQDPACALPVRLGLAGRDLTRRLAQSLPAARNEVAILGGSLFLGTLLGGWVPASALADLLGRLHLPGLALSYLLILLVIGCARLGISQLITVSLIGHALGGLGEIGIAAPVLASGLMGAWALSICVTIVGAAVLSIARLADVPVHHVGWGWNGGYAMAGTVLLGLWMALLSLWPGLAALPLQSSP